MYCMQVIFDTSTVTCERAGTLAASATPHAQRTMSKTLRIAVSLHEWPTASRMLMAS
jgi:hypothetical protein